MKYPKGKTYVLIKKLLLFVIFRIGVLEKRRSEGISNVAFEVLIINCQIDFINFFIFNCLTSNFCFPKNHIFRKQKRMTFSDVPLVLDCKLYGENSDLLSPRNK